VAEAGTFLPARGFGETTRRDPWWVSSLLTFLGFSAFVVYTTWAALQNQYYWHEPYLSPMYSPLFYGEGPHAWFGPGPPSWWPGALPFSAAMLILWMPGGFRFTCYYYRGAYYKSFWGDPPGCAVGELRKGYRGERWFPLVLQNVHRYFLYLAIGFVLFLTYDAIMATRFPAPGGGTEFGIGVGTLILMVNVVLLGGYTFGCHSLRHLVGGLRDVMSNRPVQRKTYTCVSALNRGHQRWAWFSLFVVGFADIYIRLCAMGIWTDVRLL
jgi:hypothetical protein